MKKQKLKMLKISKYAGIHASGDPIRFYNLLFIGRIYRKRVERCLCELSGGNRVLEIGFGSGVTFLNLSEMFIEIYGLDLDADIESTAATFERLGIKPFLKNGNILKLPYQDGFFDSVLLISILEHLKPETLITAFQEIRRVLRPDGEVVYGIPVDRVLVNHVFRFLGYNIKGHHFSNQGQIADAAREIFKEGTVSGMYAWPLGRIYEVGRFIKQ